MAHIRVAGVGGLETNRFSAVPLSGTTTVARNTAIRTGVLDSNWQFGVGALWFDGRDSAITGRVDVTDLDLQDNNYEAIQFIDGNTSDVHFDGVRITGAGTFAWQLQSKPTGSVKNVVATGVGRAGVYNCLGPDALAGLADQGGNSGWTTTYCGSWPSPAASPPADVRTRRLTGTAAGGRSSSVPAARSTSTICRSWPSTSRPMSGLRPTAR